MRKTLEGATGILVTAFFIAGFLTLFISNPQTWEEITNVGLPFYNLEGMNSRMWAVYLIYSAVGLLNIIFAFLLTVPDTNKGAIIAGKILLLLSGVVWLSFGVIPYDAKSDLGINLMLLRIGLLIITGSTGLVVLGAELQIILMNKFMKWYTLSSGIVILLLAFASVFIYDSSWVRTNVSFAIYFLWFGVFGLARLRGNTFANWSVLYIKPRTPSVSSHPGEKRPSLRRESSYHPRPDAQYLLNASRSAYRIQATTRNRQVMWYLTGTTSC